MTINRLRNKILFIITVGISILLLFGFISSNWAGYEIKTQCQNAQRQYGGDCIEALISVVNDETQSYHTRNSAIWALGQLNDTRALSHLEHYYTGVIPPRESFNGSISQYGLDKAIRLLKGGFNIFSWSWKWNIDIGVSSYLNSNFETVILSHEKDAYYPLAQQISKSENIPIISNLQETTTIHPLYILWIISPKGLNEEKLINTGKFYKNNDYYPAMGIITGTTIESAEKLYQRGKLAKEGNNYIGSDTDLKSTIDRPLIIKDGIQPRQEIELTKTNLIQTLETADYFYWARHVSATRWIWNTKNGSDSDENSLYAKDLPDMQPVIIHTPSCGSFYPWKENSIAMGFIEKGAAAYIGHLYTPASNNTVMLIGQNRYLPGLYTWENFPIGTMAQIQNRCTTKAGSNIPVYFMLGDPRIHFKQQQPYQIIYDQVYQNSRIIQGATDYTGIIPIKIENGAQYSYIKIDNVSSVDENSLFHNSVLQTLNLKGDKYMLFLHQGGDFHIELKMEAPLCWAIMDPLFDAFDYSWIIVAVVQSPLSLFFLAVLLLVAFCYIFRRKKSIREFSAIFFFALLFTVLQFLYIFLRIDHYHSISSQTIHLNAVNLILGCIGTFSTIAAGLIIMKDSEKNAGKILGLLISVLPQLLLTLFYMVYTTFINLMYLTQNVVSMSLWNYKPVLLPLIVLVIQLISLYLIYHYLIRKKSSTTITS